MKIRKPSTFYTHTYIDVILFFFYRCISCAPLIICTSQYLTPISAKVFFFFLIIPIFAFSHQFQTAINIAYTPFWILAAIIVWRWNFSFFSAAYYLCLIFFLYYTTWSAISFHKFVRSKLGWMFSYCTARFDIMPSLYQTPDLEIISCQSDATQLEQTHPYAVPTTVTGADILRQFDLAPIETQKMIAYALRLEECNMTTLEREWPNAAKFLAGTKHPPTHIFIDHKKLWEDIKCIDHHHKYYI